MSKFDLQELAIDSLAWITAPAVLTTWVQITRPLWQGLPPGVLILMALGVLVTIAYFLQKLLPEDSPVWLFVVRGLQMGIGLIVGMVGLLP